MEPIFIHNHLLSRNFTLTDLYLTSKSVRNDGGPTTTATNTSSLGPGSALGEKGGKNQPSVRLTNQKPRAFVSVRIIYTNRSISVHLLFLFCSRVFISRSYENRSKQNNKSAHVTRNTLFLVHFFEVLCSTT